MNCSTCNHEMDQCHDDDRISIFHCPQCGTLKLSFFNEDQDYVPQLVTQCRDFEKTFPPGNPPSVSYSAEWKRLGIHQSINKSKDKP